MPAQNVLDVLVIYIKSLYLDLGDLDAEWRRTRIEKEGKIGTHFP